VNELLGCSSTELVALACAAQNKGQIDMVLRLVGITNWLWQSWSLNDVYTVDSMPAGFIEHYYGTDADADCVVAHAVLNERWSNFAFSEARRQFAGRGRGLAEQVWQSFGLVDGYVFFAAKAGEVGELAVVSDRPVGPIVDRHGDLLSLIAWKVRQLVEDDLPVQSISRDRVRLTERQMQVLMLQIDAPQLTLQQQAGVLGMSLTNLRNKHLAVARVFGVSSFAGAVSEAIRAGVRLPPHGFAGLSEGRTGPLPAPAAKKNPGHGPGQV